MSRVWRSSDTAGVAIRHDWWCLQVASARAGRRRCATPSHSQNQIVDRADRRSPQIKIDGDFVTEQDGHGDPDQFQQELFSADDLDAGLHTVELTNLEQKFVDVDYVSVCLHTFFCETNTAHEILIC